MKTIYQSKLFWGKYPYKILFEIKDIRHPDTVKPSHIKEWLIENNINFKNRRDWIRDVSGLNFSLYVESKAELDLITTKYQDIITSITIPFLDEHIQLLKENINVIVRRRLAYNKFRYIIHFRYSWQSDAAEEIASWVNDVFTKHKRPHALRGPDYSTRLYLLDKEDLALVKLTWGERIAAVDAIVLANEIHID